MLVGFAESVGTTTVIVTVCVTTCPVELVAVAV
jgi:hypothetical protein